jgi:hypothetical protein
MKYMVEFQLKPGRKNEAVALFEAQGPNRNPGVTFRGAWVGAEADVAYVLAEGAEAQVIAVARSWSEHGEYRLTPVIDVEQF